MPTTVKRNMLWSILVCSVHTRCTSKFPRLLRLINSLEQQIVNVPVELIVLMDNRRRTTGEKRNMLMNMAQGEYISFVDDDDYVASNYVKAVLEVLNADNRPDVISFKMQFKNEQGRIDVMSFAYHADSPNVSPPMHTSVWKKTTAQLGSFPDVNYGEDTRWLEQLHLGLNAQGRRASNIFIPVSLYFYDHNIPTSESHSEGYDDFCVSITG